MVPFDAGSPAGSPLSSEYGTYKTVKAGFWPSLAGQSPPNQLSLFAQKRGNILGSGGAEVFIRRVGAYELRDAIFERDEHKLKGFKVCTSSRDTILVLDFSNNPNSLKSGRGQPAGQPPRLEEASRVVSGCFLGQ